MSLDRFTDFPIARLTDWLRRAAPEAGVLEAIDKFSLGQSNPTYRLTTSRGEFVLRKQPPGELLKSAHAVDREFRVMRALEGTGVPVPRMIALCEDRAVIGTLFFVMEYLPGRVFTNPALPELTPAECGQLYSEQVRVAAALARIDPQAIGLGDYGAPGDYVGRQLARWSKQYRASETGRIDAMEHLMDWLHGNKPPDDGQVGLVHGDFRLDNLIIHPERMEVLALVDWELSTLGHPLVDFSYWMTMLRFPAGGYFEGLPASTRREREIPDEATLLDRFIDDSGLTPPRHWQFWLAFHCFRFAAIAQGVRKRALEGNASATSASEVGALAIPVAELGWHIARDADDG